MAPKRKNACATCGKTFTKRSNMIIHARLHTGETPYLCRFGCGSRYKWLSSISFHENRCTRQTPAVPSAPNPAPQHDTSPAPAPEPLAVSPEPLAVSPVTVPRRGLKRERGSDEEDERERPAKEARDDMLVFGIPDVSAITSPVWPDSWEPELEPLDLGPSLGPGALVESVLEWEEVGVFGGML